MTAQKGNSKVNDIKEPQGPLPTDMEKLARFAVEYITEQVERKNGKDVYGDITVKLIYKGKLAQVEVTDHAAYRPSQFN